MLPRTRRVSTALTFGLLALLTFAAAPAFAYTTLPPGPGGNKPKDIEFRIAFEFAAGAARSHFSAASSGAATMTNLNYRDDFDGGAVMLLLIPSVRLSLNGAYHFEISGWEYGSSSDKVLNRNVTFQNTLFPSGNKVKATDSAYAVNFDFMYGIIEDWRNGSLRVGAGFVIQGAHDELQDQTAGTPSQKKSLTILLPELVAEGEVVLDDRWARLFARAEIAGLDNGYNLGGTAGVRMHMTNTFEMSFHMRAFTTGIMDKNSYNHYNDFIGAGIQFTFKL